MKPVVQQVSLCSGALNRAREAKGVQSWAVGETAPERKRKQIGSLMNSGGEQTRCLNPGCITLSILTCYSTCSCIRAPEG